MRINEIYNQDCIEGLKEVPKKSVSVLVTSPPYNIGVKYNEHHDDLPFNEYLNWMEEFAKRAKRVMENDGSIFFNIGDKPSDEFRSFDVAKRISKHFNLQNTIHWIKHIAIPERNVNTGHYKPVNSNRFINNSHEYIFHFTKKGDVELDKLGVGVPYADKSNIDRWKTPKKDLRDRGNVWFIPYETIWNRKIQRPHPATFPVQLPEMCIKLHGVDRTDLVLDPFMGIGTTAIACKKLGVDFIGFEIDKEYIKIAEERLEDPFLWI